MWTVGPVGSEAGTGDDHDMGLMGEAVQTVKAANNGIDAITTLIESAKSLANSALSADTTTEATRSRGMARNFRRPPRA